MPLSTFYVNFCKRNHELHCILILTQCIIITTIIFLQFYSCSYLPPLGALVITMHAYFNVYKRAQEGWNNFLLRRSAVKRLNSLEWATEEQLQQLNDVCCICYEELDSAKVTRCKHFFHSLCLRKWLYVQDKCPMCHADILPQD